MPQSPILGLLLFNIDMQDMFLKVEGHDIVSYADINTSFSGDKMLPLILNSQLIDKLLLIFKIYYNK